MNTFRVLAAQGTRGWLLIACFTALFLISQIPLYAVTHVGIQDFANHLARLHVLLRLDHDATLRGYYVRSITFAPNLAMEALVPLFALLTDLELGLKLFATLATLLFTSGAAALSIALSRQPNPFALSGLLFASSLVLHWGLLNYLFGLGLALWLLAAWVRCEQRRSPVTIIAFALAAMVVYASHLAAFAVYFVAVAVYEFGAPSPPNPGRVSRIASRSATILAQALPVLALHTVAYQPNVAPRLDVMDDLPLAHLAAYKLHLLLKGVPALVAPVYSVGLASSALGIALLWRATRDGRVVRFAATDRIAAALALAALAVPPTGFGSALLDARLLLPAAAVFFSGLAPSANASGVRRRVLGLIAIAVCTFAWTTLARWEPISEQVSDLRADLAQMTPGSRVATVLAGPTTIPAHAAGWAVIDRSAFLSSLYARPFNPVWVAFRPEYVSLADLARLDRPMTLQLGIDQLADKYDYVVIFGSPADTGGYARGAQTVSLAASYRIVRTRAALLPDG